MQKENVLGSSQFRLLIVNKAASSTESPMPEGFTDKDIHRVLTPAEWKRDVVEHLRAK